MSDSEGFLSKGGDYRELSSFRKADIIYDFTVRSCRKFLVKGDRTIGQPGAGCPFGKTECRRRQKNLGDLHRIKAMGPIGLI